MAGIFDRVIAAFAPDRAADRAEARVRLEKAQLRHTALQSVRNQYDGAARSRRTQGWRRTQKDANYELWGAAQLLAQTARDMVRNNPYAERAVSAIATDLVGTGITFQVIGADGKPRADLQTIAKAHLESTSIDADGRNNIYGLQLLVARTVVESGSVLARNRARFANDPYPLPFQVQLLEPDYLDHARNGLLEKGLYVSGIQFDQLGNRKYYWLFPNHPGAIASMGMIANPIPADQILHVFRQDRPGQQLGATWFAPVIVPMREWAEYQDGQLLRQKIAGSWAVFRIGAEGEAGSLPDTSELSQFIEPGMIEDLPVGADVKFPSPPPVEGYADFAKISIRTFATGMNLPYHLFGDLEGVNYSSGRMGEIRYNRQLDAWTWQMLISQFCDGVAAWFFNAARLKGFDVEGCTMKWTPPGRPMLDISTEGPATRDMVRSGLMTPSAAIRERGEDPDQVFAEWARDKETFTRLGLTFDCDPGLVTQVGNNAMISTSAGMPTSKAGAKNWLDGMYPNNPQNEAFAGQFADLVRLATARAQIEQSRPGDPQNEEDAHALAKLLAIVAGDA